MIWEKAASRSKKDVEKAIRRILTRYGSKVAEVFKSITVDNGSEFAGLSKLKKYGIQVYYAHPYSAWERGINECHNRMLRRFIRKGESIRRYSNADIAHFADCINALPRSLFAYATPDERFETELDRIYAR